MSARPFVDLLREHRTGLTHDTLSVRLQELVAAVSSENRAGSLTITIAMKPAGKDSGAFEVEITSKLKVPEPNGGTSIFYVTPENNLSRADPRQAVMELREVGPSLAHKGIA